MPATENRIFFSVIMPTYNRAFCIRQAVDALLNQTHRDFELIIVDDGSSDETADLIRSAYARDLESGRLRFLPQERNAGVCAARNKGLEAARYDWIAYADTDNVPRPDFLETFAQGIREHDAECFYASVYHIFSKEVFGSPSFVYKRLLKGNQIDLGAFVHSKRLYRNLGGFDTRLTRLVDWDLILTYTKTNPPVFLDKIVLDYNDSDGFKRISNTAAFDDNKKRIQRKHAPLMFRLFNTQKQNGKKIYTVFGFSFSVKSNPPLFRKEKVKKADPSAKPFKSAAPSKLCFRLKTLFATNKERRRALKSAYDQKKLDSVRIGAVYNLFDAEELLEASIRSVRSCVDYVAVVYQTVSNYGKPANEGLEDLLSRLMSDGLIDEIYRYMPELSEGGAWNERRKRNIGLEMARRKGCSHFLGMDADEFYKPEEFNAAKAFIVKHDIDTSACGLFGYVKRPEWQRISPSPVDVPFLMKIKKSSVLGTGKYFPEKVDPTRTVYPVGRFFRFSSDVVMMHHMNFVRKDLHVKYQNSSFNDNDATKYEKMLERIDSINNYQGPPDDFEGSPVRDAGNVFGVSF